MVRFTRSRIVLVIIAISVFSAVVQPQSVSAAGVNTGWRIIVTRLGSSTPASAFKVGTPLMLTLTADSYSDGYLACYIDSTSTYFRATKNRFTYISFIAVDPIPAINGSVSGYFKTVLDSVQGGGAIISCGRIFDVEAGLTVFATARITIVP
ncbi:MAG: hypothetical protein KF726_21975 [Anaerolineae bacterium]|nr:hypothetical protein [Anaerolineae bacterium]